MGQRDANVNIEGSSDNLRAMQNELIARARELGQEITDRVRRVTGNDTAADFSSLNSDETPTAEGPPLQ